ncbi:bis(5'-adenosyl)-triphosphatase enpp4-like [Babylonia areolata]|uniref:bis(5'-adenosyl)-triphosphatase enpp4-like n=1 Tax=Babylonia areolata TaxID=304850 RepID=UPI003FD2C1A4
MGKCLPPPLMLVMVVTLMSMQRSGQVWGYSGRVLLVSMDGFRWDYVRKISGLGNFSRLASTGCSLDYVDPVFITKSMPCHYSIVTGVYPENHGIIANKMYDPVLNATFSYRSVEKFWWTGFEPVWITAEKHNKSTGTYFWPGSEAEVGGYRPSISPPYNGSVPFPERVTTALDWLSEGGMDFVALYFHQPDMDGHLYGPGSPEVADRVRQMDGILGQILDGLEERKLDDVNLILTSDHGMTDIDMQGKLIDLWEYIPRSWVDRVPDFGPVTAILPVAGREGSVLSAAQEIPHCRAFRRQDVPQHLHYSHNRRIMPVIIIADEEWTVSTNVTKSREADDKGNHGYSNVLSSMKPIFFARGPDFRKGVHSTSIRSVDIYPLLCRLLGLTPAANNGSGDSTAHFLVDGGGVSRAERVELCWSGLLLVLLASLRGGFQWGFHWCQSQISLYPEVDVSPRYCCTLKLMSVLRWSQISLFPEVGDVWLVHIASAAQTSVNERGEPYMIVSQICGFNLLPEQNPHSPFCRPPQGFDQRPVPRVTSHKSCLPVPNYKPRVTSVRRLIYRPSRFDCKSSSIGWLPFPHSPVPGLAIGCSISLTESCLLV